MEHALAKLKALADATRLRLVVLLARGELTVSEIVDILGQSQPRVSRHLKLLCDAGLLDRFQEGTWVFYRISQQSGFQEFITQLLAQVNPADETLQADQDGLDEIRARRSADAQNYFKENAQSWDAIRKLYVPEIEVEAAILDLAREVEGKRLLDIGTGTGRMLEMFAPYVSHGIGVDLSRDMLAIARSSLLANNYAHCEVRQGDMYALGLDDCSVDMVTIHQVLHYADEPSKVLAEASRVLTPGGQLLVADFAPHGREDLRESHQHRRLGFSDDEMVSWADEVGLARDEIRHLEGGDLVVTLWRFEKTIDQAAALLRRRVNA